MGRAATLALLRHADAAKPAILTLTGPPGVGKSTLLDAWAESRGGDPEWARRVVCSLRDAGGPDELSRRLAAALGVGASHSPEARLEAIDAALRARGGARVVLEDADDAMDALSESLPRWLAAAPEARFVVTSRGRTGVRQEAVVEVPPLSGEDASALMVELAQRVRPGWEPAAEDRADLDEIARRLGGVPLAMELAARWLDLLSPAEVRERLTHLEDEDAARLGGPLLEAVASSWRALSKPARETFAQCGVFEGSFTAEAAEAVVELPAGAGRVIDAVSELRRRSLVQRIELHGRVRLTLVAPFRRFARWQLERRGGREEAERRHARYFGEAASEWRGRWMREGHERWRRAMFDDAEELRAVVARHVSSKDRQARRHAAHALLALEQVFLSTSLVDAEPWIDRALEGIDDETRELELRRMRGVTRHHRGDPAGALVDLEEVARRARRRDDAMLEGEALLDLAQTRAGGRDQALERLARARARFAEAGAPAREAHTLDQLGLLHLECGRPAEARALFLEASERARGLGDRYEGAYLAHLAFAALESGLLDDAAAWLEAAQGHEADDYPLARLTSNLWAYLHHLRGELDLAARRYAEARELCGRAGLSRYEAMYTGYLGLVHYEQGEQVSAVRAFEAARERLTAIDREHAALFVAALGAVRADQGLPEEAEALLREARALLAEGASRSFVTAVSSLAAHVDLARGEQERARRRLEDAWWGGERKAIDVRLVLRTIPAALRRTVEEPTGPAASTLTVHRSGHWMRLPEGEVVALAKKRVARRIVLELARARVEAPGEPMDAHRLFERAWEGERVLPGAAKNRLHVALSALRKLGLRDWIEAVGDGYRFRRELRVSLSDDPEP